MKIVKLEFCIWLLAASVTASFAQDASPTPLRVATNLVQIDISVTDKQGRPIRDLKQEEFEILENDKRQQISNFSFIAEAERSTAAPVDPAIPVPAAVLRPESVTRTIALVVDDNTLSFESTAFVRQALKRFINEQMVEGDLIAIIRTAGGIGALQQFTSDKRQLLAAIDRIRWNRLGTSLASFDPLVGEIDTNSEEFATVNSGAGDRMPKDVDKEDAAYRSSLFATGTIGALNYVMRGMLTLPGRKSIVMMSDGFKLFSYDPSGMIGTTPTFHAIKKLVEDANRASVVIYTMDARGLQTLGFTAADSPNTIDAVRSNALLAERRADFRDTQEGLIHLAEETGGFAVVNNNDINAGLRRVMADQSYYMIGFLLGEDVDPDKERSNKLTVRVKRDGAVVRYRSAFYGIRDGTAGRPIRANRYDQIYEAIASPFAVNGINMRLNALFAYNEKDKSFLKSFIHVNAKDLQFSRGMDGKFNATLRIMAIRFGDNGLPVDRQDITATLQIPPDKIDGIMRTGYIYGFSFPVKKPGAFQMRVAVRDENNGKVGSANQFIEAPDLKKTHLAMSGIVIENLPAGNAGKTGPVDPGDSTRRDLAMGDTSLRRFKRGTMVGYAAEIYSRQLAKGKKQPVNVYIRVFRNGQLLLKGDPRTLDVIDPKRPIYSGAIGLGDQMEPGDYILQIVAEEPDPGGKGSRLAYQSVQFEVID